MTNPHYKFVHEYLTFARAAFDRTAKGGKVQLDWAGSRMNAAAWREEFVSALFRRMDAKAGIVDRGRKRQQMYQIGLRRDAHRLRDIQRRIRVYQFETPELSRRFGHLLSSYND